MKSRTKKPRQVTFRAYVTRLIVMCVVPLLLLAIYLAARSVIGDHQKRIAQIENLAANTATSIDLNLQSKMAGLGMLAASPLVDDKKRWHDLYAEAKGFQRNFGGHVIFADTDRRMLFNTREPFGTDLPLLPTPKGRSSVQEALKTLKPSVGDIVFGPVANQLLVTIAVPVLQAEKASHVFLSTLDANLFQVRLNQVELPGGWSISLLDGQGKEVAHSGTRISIAGKNQNEVDRVVAPLKLSGWSIALEAPMEIRRQEETSAVISLGLAVLAVVLLSLLGGVMASRVLNAEITSLTRKPMPGLPEPKIIEIAMARRGLDEVEAARSRIEKDLVELNADLERRVAERTQALGEARLQADQANRAKSDFLASMSHELRTPLNAVLGFSQLLAIDPELPPDRQENAREIERAGKLLLTLITEILDLSRIESGRMELEMQPIALKTLTDKCFRLVAGSAKSAGVELIDADGDGQHAMIEADPIRLQQVILNFLTNAIKYNRPQGKVRLSYVLSGASPEALVRIIVSDTGFGIPADKQARVFGAFDRLGLETGNIEGTGIGLLITKRIVEAMGGAVGFTSVEGEGSTFWAEFPVLGA